MHTLVEQVAAVRSAAVSATDLVTDALARLERVQATTNALTVIDGDRALHHARALDAAAPSGPLHGVPLAVKDLFGVEGLATSGCCAAYHDRVARDDGAVVRALRAAGAVIVAKTNQHELACGTTTQVTSFGPVRNPWDTTRIPGGSSGGSGAAVATRAVMAAMGSDTGGSIRIPASMCGVTGLKPTHGAVSLAGAMPMTPSLDTAGPLAVSAADCALIHRVIAGFDPVYRYSRAAPGWPTLTRVDGLRVGVLEGFLDHCEPATRGGVRDAADALASLGAVVTSCDDGPDPRDTRDRFAPLLIAEVAHHYRDLWDDERPSVPIQRLIAAGRAVAATDYTALREAGADLRNAFGGLLADHDVLLAPTTPYPAPPIDADEIPVTSGSINVHAAGPATLTIPFNIAGLPSLSFPTGRSAEGLPLSAQLIGPEWSELTLCAVIDAFQRETDHHLEVPPG